ncbi:hypothetical protein M9H77_30240 [Catharanthus roseus]|uniref:Uncharacterized protein n=1 Tax=Catharanthus roseus TaxID=4058 RepID=A0ACB9ZWP0_CATRO|nr:hypothetical protein M9H77_30240 [Catharanthus roseus]
MKTYIMGIHGWILGFEKDERFQFHYPFKDYGFKACFETVLTSVFLRSFFLNLFSQMIEKTSLVWNFETFSNFLFLTLQSFQDLSFYYHIPLKEVLRIDVISWMHLHDFLVHLCAYLERNHIKLLWFVSTFSMKHAKLPRIGYELPRPITRSRARKIEEETQRNKFGRV